jgi:integrase
MFLVNLCQQIDTPGFMMVNLRRAQLKNKTNQAYDRAKLHFFRYLRLQHNRMSVLAFKALPVFEQDSVLADFVQHSYAQWRGKFRQTVVNAVYAMVRDQPQLRRNIKSTLACLAGWTKLRPSRQHSPIPRDMAVAIATTLVAMGKVKMALAVMTSFEGLLRAQEVLSLRGVHVFPPDLRYPGMHLSLLIIGAKTGRLQYVTIQDPEVARLLQMTAPSSTMGLLFPFSYSTYLKYFKKAVAILGLPARFTPHGLRSGGATHLRLYQGASLEEVRFRGRWASLKSVDAYQRSSAVLMMLLQQSFRRVLTLGKNILKKGLCSTWRALL